MRAVERQWGQHTVFTVNLGLLLFLNVVLFALLLLCSGSSAHPELFASVYFFSQKCLNPLSVTTFLDNCAFKRGGACTLRFANIFPGLILLCFLIDF